MAAMADRATIAIGISAAYLLITIRFRNWLPALGCWLLVPRCLLVTRLRPVATAAWALGHGCYLPAEWFSLVLLASLRNSRCLPRSRKPEASRRPCGKAPPRHP